MSKRNIVSFIAFLVLVLYLNVLSAEEIDSVVFSTIGTFKVNKQVVELKIRDSELASTPKCDKNKNQWPPYEMANAINDSIEWGLKKYPTISWKLTSVELMFHLDIKGICFYVINFDGKDIKTNSPSSLSVGLTMDGKLIEPKIKDVTHRKHRKKI